MQLRHKIPLIIIGVIVFVSTINAYSYYKTQLWLIESAKKQQLKGISSLMRTSIDSQSKMALVLAQTITSVSSIKQTFKSQNRQKLLDDLSPTYSILKTNYGVELAHFHVPSAVSFLRLHNPKKFGDDLSKSRDMILLSNSRRETYSGLEIGGAGVAI